MIKIHFAFLNRSKYAFEERNQNCIIGHWMNVRSIYILKKFFIYHTKQSDFNNVYSFSISIVRLDYFTKTEKSITVVLKLNFFSFYVRCKCLFILFSVSQLFSKFFFFLVFTVYSKYCSRLKNLFVCSSMDFWVKNTITRKLTLKGWNIFKFQKVTNTNHYMINNLIQKPHVEKKACEWFK